VGSGKASPPAVCMQNAVEELIWKAQGPEKIPSLALPSGHFVPADSSDLACFQLIRDWLTDCDSNHVDCASVAAGPNDGPARMIEIQSDPQANDNTISLKIVEQPVISSQYVALSYCWGDGDTNATTSANYQERLVRLAAKELPKTYQDAFQICLRLGIHYLWVCSQRHASRVPLTNID
jgi:hypothetical protein